MLETDALRTPARHPVSPCSRLRDVPFVRMEIYRLFFKGRILRFYCPPFKQC